MSSAINILMITRKIDHQDALAGFTYGWVDKIAKALKSFDANGKLYIICLEKGDVLGLPDNVEIHSLGKEMGVSRFGRFIEFQKSAFRLVKKVDGIFCHMNPEYTINIWPYAKWHRKKIVSWYTHGAVTWKTKLLAKMADVILSASLESFPIESKKVIATGHGIDTDLFQPKWKDYLEDAPFCILTVGRISPTKDLESLIKAIDILDENGEKNMVVKIVGEPGLPEHQSYYDSLQQMVRAMDLERTIEFTGPIPNKDVVHYLQDADVFINLSGTKSVDKAVLEAMACGCIVITSNKAFQGIISNSLIIEENQPKELAKKLFQIKNLSRDKKEKLRRSLREEVLKNHNLSSLAKVIVEQFVA